MNITSSRPNIIFIFGDQMRASSPGFMGVEKVYTPNLDSFAREGTAFTRAISNTPVCAPARATLFSGMHPLRHGVVFNDVALRTDIQSLALCLNEIGYRCGYIGKWHLDTEDRGIYVPPGPRRQGFNDYWAAHNCNHHYFEGYYYLNDDPNPIWIDGFEPEVQTELAINYIAEKSNGNDPFCMFLSWGPPHCPYLEVPKKYLDMYPVEDIQLKPNAVETADKRQIAGYYAQITALDEYFGKILQAVEENGLRENTIVIFTSDHGDMLFSHNRGWKCKPWLESVNVPFLARWPGKIPRERVSDGLLGIVDIAPTLLSLCGADIPAEMQGTDLSELFMGNETASPDSAFIGMPVVPLAFSYPEWRGVMTKHTTYARFREEPWILYDDNNDPFQLTNLVHSPAHQDLLIEMEERLQGWLKCLDDPFETTLEVCSKYYQGAINGEMHYYENEIIRLGKAERRRRRLSQGSEPQ